MLPESFPEPRVPASNRTSTAKVELGRRLFYDARLSANGTQSCASCHQQALAFTDGRVTAIGSTGKVHPRNTPSLVNAGYLGTLTWANPAMTTLEKQMHEPLFSTTPVEMGVNDGNRRRVLARIAGDRGYAARFRAAFPGRKSPVQWPAVIDAIAAFERTVVSAGSKFDRAKAGRVRLSASETRGEALFMGERAGCARCHGSFLFNDQTKAAGQAPQEPVFHNDGLYSLGGTGGYPAPNRGLFEHTGDPADMGEFRAPSLRNVELTAPYMHDGSIETLEAVVEHYVRGGRLIERGPLAGDGATSPLKDPMLTGLALGDRDQRDLVAFLKTLTDRSVPTNPRFSDPRR